MLLSLILAWLAVFFAVFTALKYIARISKNRKLNRFFSRSHIPYGKLLIITGLLHGILAGNPAWASLSDMMIAPVLFTWNWGTAIFVVSLMLGASYWLRKKLRKSWMPIHRVLTVVLIGMLVLHVVNVGIQIDNGLLELGTSNQEEQVIIVVPDTSDEEESALAESTVESTPGSTAQPTSDVQDPEATTEQSGISGVIEEVTEMFSGAQLLDGTYEGSATGYSGDIAVSVTVSGGQVTEISVLNETETPQYFSRAESILDTIISGQSLNVDAVSGATFTSAGLVNAVAAALQDAVASGALDVAEYDLSSADRRH